MKRISLSVMVFIFLYAATGYAVPVTVYQNDYEGETPGAGFPAWNWGTAECVHTAVFADYGPGFGGIVVEHTGVIDNSAGTEAVDARFGSKWDIMLSGNVSANPEHYTISFDIMNLMGNWNPHPIEFFIVTNNPDVGTDQYGYGSGTTDYYQTGMWDHVEMNLADMPVGWWQGQDWDLTQSTWSIEVGGPGWPGASVAPGEAWTQMWLMDNLEVVMDVPEPASLVLLGLGALTVLRKRK